MISDCRTATTYASWAGNKLLQAKKKAKFPVFPYIVQDSIRNGGRAFLENMLIL